MAKEKRISEKEFLSAWEKNHPRPKKREEVVLWKQMRKDALAHWQIEREADEKEQKQKQEKEAYLGRMKRHINNRILEKQYDMKIVQEMCYLPGVEPYSETTFENTPVFSGMSCFASLACLSEFDQLDELAARISQAVMDNASLDDCDKIWRELLEPEKGALIQMRRMSQCGRAEEIADQTQLAIQEMVRSALLPDWSYSRTMRFMGDEMIKTFYQVDDTNNPELSNFKKTFRERDKGQSLQKFQALKRMTELVAFYHKCVERLRNPASENEVFTSKELRDFFVGSYVAKELKKTYENGDLTPEAMKIGEITTKTATNGSIEVIYGDEAIYQEMKQSKTYQQLENMKIGEISRLIGSEGKEIESIKKEKVNIKDRVMVLKPDRY